MALLCPGENVSPDRLRSPAGEHAHPARVFCAIDDAATCAAEIPSSPWPGLCGDVVRDAWLFTHQFTQVFFDDAIGVGDALMLSQVFQPGIDEECLEHSFGVRSILVQAPRVGAVALALAAEAPNSRKERFPHFSRHPVFERNQHRTRVVQHLPLEVVLLLWRAQVSASALRA